MRHILFLFFALSVCGKVAAQTYIPPFDAHELSISWQAIENNYQNKAQSLNALVITNNGHEPLPASGWKLYFNSARGIISTTVSGYARIDKLNGDLFTIHLRQLLAG